MTDTILDAGRAHLRQLASDCDSTGHSAAGTLDYLAVVADHTCRIGDHFENTHYAMDKSRPLMYAAINTHRHAMHRWSAQNYTDEETFVNITGFELDELHDLLADFGETIANGSYSMARWNAPHPDDVTQLDEHLTNCKRLLTRWRAIARNNHDD